MRTQRGVTLVEMLVALALLGVIAGVATVQLIPARLPGKDQVATLLAGLRHRAIREARTITATLTPDSAGAKLVTAFPDGRVVADPSVPVDPFTGYVNAAR